MTNGWTGGQYSLFRAVFGTYLLVHFVQLVPWSTELFSNRGVIPEASTSPVIYLFPNVLSLFDGPVFATALVAFAAGLALFFAIGLYDRVCAILIWYVWACLFGRDPLILNPGLPYVGWMLLAHAFLPGAPYGSCGARGRTDPGNGWRMPAGIFTVAWVLMALGYSYSGYTKLISPSWLDGTAMAHVLDNPLARPNVIRDALASLPVDVLKIGTWASLGFELLFAPLALVRRFRPILWGSMLLMHLSLIALIDFADLSLGMVMMHLFTFDPNWVKASTADATDIVFFDGNCGLCHRAVRFVLTEDRRGNSIRFAPLGGDTFVRAMPEDKRANLPDSIVVRTAKGELFIRSGAILYLMQRLGGAWYLLAAVAWVIPPMIRDFAYDLIARVRYRLFRSPSEACPLIPGHLRSRFDL